MINLESAMKTLLGILNDFAGIGTLLPTIPDVIVDMVEGVMATLLGLAVVRWVWS